MECADKDEEHLEWNIQSEEEGHRNKLEKKIILREQFVI